jgi:hypothetical protein
MQTDVKIRKDKIVAILGEDFSYEFYGRKTIAKGYEVDAKKLTLNGYEIVLGHGNSEYIPFDKFTKFIHTWSEETTKGNATKTVHKRECVTKFYLDWYKKKKEKIDKRNLQCEQSKIKYRIAHLKKIIKQVQSGEIQAEIDKLTASLNSLSHI